MFEINYNQSSAPGSVVIIPNGSQVALAGREPITSDLPEPKQYVIFNIIYLPESLKSGIGWRTKLRGLVIKMDKIQQF